jgi:hypothetical protein
MRKFGLELHPEKTRSIEFGRFAEDNRKRRKWFTVRRRTVKQRLRSKLQAIRQELQAPA